MSNTIDLTDGINPYQSPEDMAAEWTARENKKDQEALEACTVEEQHEPTREAERAVARGRLCPETGTEIPLSSKARRLTRWVPSQAFQDNYDQIRWDR